MAEIGQVELPIPTYPNEPLPNYTHFSVVKYTGGQEGNKA